MTGKLVIYTRFSSDMQRQDSCADQERDVRAALARMGIDTSSAVVVSDEAESGTKADREKFELLKAMVGRDEVRILAVDDQSRLSRADNVFGFIQDLVYHGGRFISTGEGIDTLQKGWELRVQVMGLHNSHTIRELGHRVRRGQEGRVRDDGSAGDFPYGYESHYLDANWQAQLAARGPKPKKGVSVCEAEAKWVRQIFVWFVVQLWSIAAIARELTRQAAPRGHQATTPGWTHTQVRRILSNPKYVGEWTWGATTTIRNSNGKKKQVPVPATQVVTRNRPALQIVEPEVYAKAQDRLRELQATFGKAPGAPKTHSSAVYPQSLCGGLIYCGLCGSRLWYKRGAGKPALGCPNHRKGLCTMSTLVLMETAEQALLRFLQQLLISDPAFVRDAIAAMRTKIDEAVRLAPESLEDDRKYLAKLQGEINNLVEILADGTFDSPAVKERLQRIELEAAERRRKIAEAERVLAMPVALPDDRWIQHQFRDLPSLLKDEGLSRLGVLLRQLLGRVTAHPVIAPGKQRGYPRLRFRINGWVLLREALGNRIPEGLTALGGTTDRGDAGVSPEFVIDLGKPTAPDDAAPRIAELRAAGKTWKEIAQITGVSIGNAYNFWKRYVQRRNMEGPAA